MDRTRLTYFIACSRLVDAVSLYNYMHLGTTSDMIRDYQSATFADITRWGEGEVRYLRDELRTVDEVRRETQEETGELFMQCFSYELETAAALLKHRYVGSLNLERVEFQYLCYCYFLYQVLGAFNEVLLGYQLASTEYFRRYIEYKPLLEATRQQARDPFSALFRHPNGRRIQRVIEMMFSGVPLKWTAFVEETVARYMGGDT